jgi:hypothetical protein
MKILYFFLYLWAIFALLDLDPHSKCGSGSTTLSRRDEKLPLIVREDCCDTIIFVPGELPPLTGSRPLGLAPLKKIPPLPKPDAKKPELPSQESPTMPPPAAAVSKSDRLSEGGRGKDQVREH